MFCFLFRFSKIILLTRFWKFLFVFFGWTVPLRVNNSLLKFWPFQGQKTTFVSLLGIFLSWLFLYFSKKCFGKVSKWGLVFEASCKRGSLGLPLSHGLLSRWLITLSPYSPNTSALTCISTLTEYAFEKLIQLNFYFFLGKINSTDSLSIVLEILKQISLSVIFARTKVNSRARWTIIYSY